jgi:hypothetical protein
LDSRPCDLEKLSDSEVMALAKACDDKLVLRLIMIIERLEEHILSHTPGGE